MQLNGIIGRPFVAVGIKGVLGTNGRIDAFHAAKPRGGPVRYVRAAPLHRRNPACSAQISKEVSNITNEQVGRFHRGEVTAALEV